MTSSFIDTVRGRLAALLPGRAALPRELVIIAAARTGTNHLCGTLGGFPGTLMLHEIFDESAVYGLNGRPWLLPHFARLLGRPLSGEDDPALIDFFRRNPARAMAELAGLAAAHGVALLGHKVFPDQLPAEDLTRLLAERRPAVLFVVRQRLASYVSLLKAKSSGRWTNFDSSGVMVEADVTAFLAWSARRDSWYAEMHAVTVAAALPHLTLSYERHLDAPGEELTGTLTYCLSTLGIALPPPRLGRHPAFARQDGTAGVFQRLANGRAFEQSLIEAGKLDYALGAPLAETVWAVGRAGRDR